MSKALCIDAGFEWFTRNGKSLSKVMIIDSKYTEIKEKITEVFDFFEVDVRDKSVLLKPNLLWPSEPEQGLNTHPLVIEAVVEECERRGAKEVFVGDNAGQIMYGNSKGAFYGSGLGERLGKYYVNLGINLEPHYLKESDKTVYISKIIKEVDYLINIPKFKTHKLTGLTACLKNTYGYLPGAQKAKGHVSCRTHERFAKFISEIHNIRKPDLNIIDSILGMQGNGASSKDLRYIGKIIASKDPVAADALVAKMMGMDPSIILHVKYAQEMGLGTYQNLDIIGDWEVIDGFMLAPGFADPAQLRDTVTSEGLENDASRMNPIIFKDKCTKCGACVTECPVGALVMDEFPVEVAGLCVSCHACQEICEESALILGATI